MHEERGSGLEASTKATGLELSRWTVTAPRGSSVRAPVRTGNAERVDDREARRRDEGMNGEAREALGEGGGKGKAQMMESGHALVLDSMGAQRMDAGGIAGTNSSGKMYDVPCLEVIVGRGGDGRWPATTQNTRTIDDRSRNVDMTLSCLVIVRQSCVHPNSRRPIATATSAAGHVAECGLHAASRVQRGRCLFSRHSAAQLLSPSAFNHYRLMPATTPSQLIQCKRTER